MIFYSNTCTHVLQQHDCQEIISHLSWSLACQGQCSHFAFHTPPLREDRIQLHGRGLPHREVTLGSASPQASPSRSPSCAWCWKEAPGHST